MPRPNKLSNKTNNKYNKNKKNEIKKKKHTPFYEEINKLTQDQSWINEKIEPLIKEITSS